MIKCVKCKIDKDDNKCYRNIQTCESCYMKEYKRKNKERIAKNNHDNYILRKPFLSEENKKYRKENALRISKQRKQYRTENRAKITAYFVNRYRTDPIYRLKQRYRNQINKLIKRNFTTKAASSSKLLGCSPQELKIHLELKFQYGMSWENHGFGENKWHIDHIIPCDSFDLTSPDEQRICFHYTNLQPLWQSQNLSKSNKI